jgi:hypothetical protein
MIVTHIIRDRFILGLEFSPETIHAMDDEVEANEPEALTRLLFAHAARFLTVIGTRSQRLRGSFSSGAP